MSSPREYIDVVIDGLRDRNLYSLEEERAHVQRAIESLPPFGWQSLSAALIDHGDHLHTADAGQPLLSAEDVADEIDRLSQGL